MSCKNCKKVFTDYVKKNRQYCSKQCSNENYSNRTKIECKCQVCGEQIITNKSKIRKFCSVKCKNESDSIRYRGEGNPNFGNRKPNMFTHTEEAKKKIKEKVTNSWTTSDRKEKHKKFLQLYKKEYGYIPLHSPEAKIKAYEEFLKTLGNRKYGGWKGIKAGWYISTKTNKAEYYHSSYELNRMIELDNDATVVSWTKQHPFLVEYVINNVTKKYKPDFYIEYKNGVKCAEEVKGYVPDEEIEGYCSKVEYATKYFSELGINYFVNFNYKKENEVICGQS